MCTFVVWKTFAKRDEECPTRIFISFGSSLLSIPALGWRKSMPSLNKDYFIFLAIIAFDKFIWRDFVEFLFCMYRENQVVMWFFCFILLTWCVMLMREYWAYLGCSPLGHSAWPLMCAVELFAGIFVGIFVSVLIIDNVWCLSLVLVSQRLWPHKMNLKLVFYFLEECK